MKKQFAVLHSGSNELRAVAGRWTGKGDYVLEGFYRSPSRGIREGMVTDLPEAADSVSKCLNVLKERTGSSFRDVYSSVTSLSVDIVPSSGDMLLSKYGREITPSDIKKCVELGSVVKLPLDREPLHNMVGEFSVDGERNIKDPVSLEAVRLGVRLNIITINSSALRNLEKCINMAGYLSAGFVFSGLASSFRLLSREEKARGTALVRVSEELTEVVLFNRGVMAGAKVFPSGEMDLVRGDGTVNAEALESLLKGMTSMDRWGEMNKVIALGDGIMRDALIEELERSFDLAVEIGSCAVKPFEHLPDDRMGYVVSLGMMDYMQQDMQKRRTADSLLGNTFHRAVEFLDRYF